MEKLKSLLSLLVLVLSVAGCAGGDDDDDDGSAGTLTSGVYLVTSSVTQSDGCGIGPAVQENDTMNVTVSGNNISIGTAVDGQIDGGDIDAPDPSPNQSTTNAGSDSCTETTRDDFSGTITGDDQFTLVEEYTVSVSNPGNWAGCPYTECESRFTYQAQK